MKIFTKLASFLCCVTVCLAVTVAVPTAAQAAETDCLSFTSNASFTITANPGWNGTMQVSTNHTSWNTWTGSPAAAAQINGVYTLYVRGMNNTVVTGSQSHAWTIASSSPVDCRGNIMTLLNYANPRSASMGDSCYASMFYNCEGLVTPPELPATTLAASCYRSMFYGCKSLETAPDLPALYLEPYCYDQMFQACDSLTKAANMSAVSMQDRSCHLMYFHCDKLSDPGTLPATSLYQYCYAQMFSNCASLVAAPKLPATTLATSCYEYMFEDCVNLEDVPDLDAVTLASSCYNGMFEGCIALEEAPSIAAKNMAWGCCTRMFYGCESLTLAPDLPAKNLAHSCYGSMFHGCTSLMEAPALPATVLASSCYRGMFFNCTSLVRLPDLPATNLQPNCYYQMFKNCSGIELYINGSGEKWKLPANVTTADSWGYEMFANVQGDAPATPTPGTSYFYWPAYTDCERWVREYTPGVYGLYVHAPAPDMSDSAMRVPVYKVPGSRNFTSLYFLPDLRVWCMLVKSSVRPDPEDFTIVTSAAANNEMTINNLFIPRPNYAPVGVAGDINGNGSISVVDAQIAYDMATGKYQSLTNPASMNAWLRADVNGDGSLDATDAFAIQSAMLRGWSGIPVG